LDNANNWTTIRGFYVRENRCPKKSVSNSTSDSSRNLRKNIPSNLSSPFDHRDIAKAPVPSLSVTCHHFLRYKGNAFRYEQDPYDETINKFDDNDALMGLVNDINDYGPSHDTIALRSEQQFDYDNYYGTDHPSLEGCVSGAYYIDGKDFQMHYQKILETDKAGD